MPRRSCLYEIHARLESLTGKERQVADHVLANPSAAVEPSIEELAERIGVSESTLFRFVRKLGYDGYQQFRIALATETVEPRRMVYEAALPEGSADAGAQGNADIVFRTNIEALERTLRHLDREALERAVRMVAEKRSVLLFGLGGSAVVALDAYHKLLRSGLQCRFAEDYHLQLMLASQAREGDAALLVSHTGANKDALALAEELKREGAALIVLTSYPRSPLARMADVLLLSSAPVSTVASEAFSARIAQLSIIDALYVGVMERLGGEGIDKLERMRGAIARRRT
ncbi:MAG: MurR/RpiR family transcriptional regulator [Spirochaetales bacterium]|nr:MurR/RpiR family transcriptional regulator [Spirochaetales bacterium]